MKGKLWWIGMFLLLFFGSMSSVYAQCGASLSSCKTCHEVKRAMPVMTKGDWHKDHSFGDFCEFCHGGNTASKVQAEAHEGINMIPVKTPGNTCSSCHPDDYNDRAQTYAEILNVEIDESGGGAEQTASNDVATDAPAEEKSSGESTNIAKSEPVTSVSVPSGGEVVDFNELLNEDPDEHPINTGNAILIVLIIGLSIVFLGMYWGFNRDEIKAKVKKIADETSDADDESQTLSSDESRDELIAVLERRPNLRQLFYQLQDADPLVIDALISITSQNGESEKLIKSLGRVDMELLKRMQTLNDSELDVLLTLARKM
ncbi:MAG: hypothetical protein K9N46_04865 [Candidatus Marinimicrobia bacterium]|nr:hypothetical protein [Candidatus Neomarinimicrobiota bacterium]MCF7829285.1 hypothetical protein [Candidatus Neomarinimicrobiota bacterium]MCF7880053.1 hypothetical protein [Candidatus Neomarinimicrobiota bacterium]